MSDAHARTWTGTFIAVLAVEAVVIGALWAFSRYFSY